MKNGGTKPPKLIQSLQRAFEIINCFDFDTKYLSINEIALKVDLNPNTVRSIVQTLVFFGYLNHNKKDNNYSLGYIYVSKAEIIDKAYLSGLKEIVEPILIELSTIFKISARLQMVNNDRIFTVTCINPINTHYIVLSRMDAEFPLHASASGKLFLYFSNDDFRENYLADNSKKRYNENTKIDRQELMEELNFISDNGYSREFEEFGIGISSIAFPITNDSQGLIGTISVTGPSKMILESQHDIKDLVISFIKRELKQPF